VGVDFCFSVNTLLETPEFSGEKIPRLPSSIISKPISSEACRRPKSSQDNIDSAKDDDEDANENDDLREMEGPER
jgi:hypothetical protein